MFHPFLVQAFLWAELVQEMSICLLGTVAIKYVCHNMPQPYSHFFLWSLTAIFVHLLLQFFWWSNAKECMIF